MTLKELLTIYIDKLKAIYDTEEATSIFRLAVSHHLNYGYAQFLMHQFEELKNTDEANFLTVLQRLEKGEPIQHIIGETEFYGLKFKVNPSVLIPRPETEELVQLVTNNVLDKNGEINILDVGTGSGCIAISLKANISNANVYATDIALDSLETATKNAELNNVRVSFVQHDILAEQNLNNIKLDVIVSNPPYIKEDEKEAMHINVMAHEPHRALFVSNENPLIFYKAIADFALQNLEENGQLFFEINEYLGKETLEMIKSKGFKNCVLLKDLQGKDRMIKANI